MPGFHHASVWNLDHEGSIAYRCWKPVICCQRGWGNHFYHWRSKRKRKQEKAWVSRLNSVFKMFRFPSFLSERRLYLLFHCSPFLLNQSSNSVARNLCASSFIVIEKRKGIIHYFCKESHLSNNNGNRLFGGRR